MPSRITHVFYSILRIIAAIVAVAGVTAVDARFLGVNSATVAFTYLLLILGIATRVGLAEAIAASLASVFAYNFFFLPPIGTLTIADPQNWVALCAFLITAVTASELSASVRRKADEARSREQEILRLYELSRALMLSDEEQGMESQIVQKIASLFQLSNVSFFDRASERAFTSGRDESSIPETVLREVALTGISPLLAEQQNAVIPIQIGGRLLGSLGVAHATLSNTALQAIAQLAAISIERAHAQKEANRAEAARQSEQLKSTLLDALAHEFKTPLTSIKAASTTVLARHNLHQIDEEMLTIIDEESDRMTDLVTEAIELARIEGSRLQLKREPYAAHALISSAISRVHAFRDGRSLAVNVADDLSLLDIDLRRSELMLRQLIDNAAKYSSSASSVRIKAEEQEGYLLFMVSNDGPGIPMNEQKLIFEKFYRGAGVRDLIPGSGMGLTIACEIIEAHGGRIWVESEPGKGAAFYFTLPTVAAGRPVSAVSPA